MRALQRATFATLVATGVAVAAAAGVAAQTSQNFPTKPVRMIVPFTADSATDLLARRIALKMSDNCAAGVDVVHVPYKGVPEQLIDTMTGRIHYFLSPLVPALPFIKDGRLLALAVSTARRTSVLPDVPTIAEAALPGYEFQAWFGVFAPARTPRPVVEQFSREIARIVDLPDIKKQMLNLGEEGRSSTPEEFTQFVRAEIEKVSKIVKLAGIRIE